MNRYSNGEGNAEGNGVSPKKNKWSGTRRKIYGRRFWLDIGVNGRWLRMLDALMTRGFIVKYTVDGANYGCVPSFSRHQVVNNRESASQLPGPGDATSKNQLDSVVSPSDGRVCCQNERVEHASRSRTRGKGKGSEWKMVTSLRAEALVDRKDAKVDGVPAKKKRYEQNATPVRECNTSSRRKVSRHALLGAMPEQKSTAKSS